MTKGEDFSKQGKCKNKHWSSLCKNAWCDLNNKGDILKLHDKCANCNCQKLITITSRQSMFEGGSKKSNLKLIFKGTKTAWDN